MKKIIGSIVLIVILSIINACGSQETGNQVKSEENASNKGKEFTLKLGTGTPEGEPLVQAMETFSKAVEERTEGKVKIEVYASGTLGTDRDMIEQGQSGANVGAAIDPGRLIDMVPDMGIMGAPYLVDDFDEVKTLVTSDLFKGWEEQLTNEHNLQVLAYNWHGGLFHLGTTKAVQTPEDLEGLKIRSPESPLWLETTQALGGSATGMDFQEFYPGVQQGVVDGGNLGVPTFYFASLYEVLPHLVKTGHIQLLQGIIVGKDWFDTLPSEYQEILLEEAFKAGDESARLAEELAKELEQKLTDLGVEIHEVDRDLFKEKTNVVYEKLGYQDLRKQINEVIEK